MIETKLYSFALSPFVLKARSYLLYKRIPFETVHVAPMQIRKILPIGTTVPVLVHGDEARNESLEIGLWLDELFPEHQLVAPGRREEILKADAWVTERLIPTVFRITVGHGDSWKSRLSKRWELSRVLNVTTPDGVSLPFRVAHALFVHLAPMLQEAIRSTNLEMTNDLWRNAVTQEFVELLAGGPFLTGGETPSLADLSAFSQVIVPELRRTEPCLAHSPEVDAWVHRMRKALPEFRDLLPGEILR